MANFYKYTKAGDLIETFTSTRNGDITYMGGGDFLLGVVSQGVYRFRIEGTAFAEQEKLVDFSGGVYSLNSCVGVEFRGKEICVNVVENSLPAKSHIEIYDWTGDRNARYQFANNDTRDGLTFDGKYFWTWNRTSSPDELEQVRIEGSTAFVEATFGSSFNALVATGWDGKYLWMPLNSSGAGHPIAQVDTKGKIEGSFSHGISNKQGVCTDGKYIYVISN